MVSPIRAQGVIHVSEAKTAYCKKCGKDVKLETRSKQDKAEVNGRSYTFRRQIALCPKCGKELVYHPYDIAAEQELQRVSDSSTGLVTPEQIAELPWRYAIGKRPLSKLLGWGELTYTRLLEGRTPTQEHSDELRHLLEEPAAYARLLEQGHAQGIITDVAYQRSRRALDEILTEEHQDSAMLFDVADRFCIMAQGDLTPRALQMLVYFTQGWSIARLGEPLFDALPRAASYGPEYRQIRDAYSFADIQATFERGVDTSAANERLGKAVKVIEAVYQKYGDMSGSALCREARSQAPWRKARKRAEAPEGAECEELLTLKSLKKNFAKQK